MQITQTQILCMLHSKDLKDLKAGAGQCSQGGGMGKAYTIRYGCTVATGKLARTGWGCGAERCRCSTNI